MDGFPCPIPQRIGIVHKVSSAEAAETAVYVAQFLRAKGVEVITDEAETARSADLVVVLGGDGTLIHAASLVNGRQVPILGINMGSLGFMTEVPQSEMYPMLDAVLAGQAQVSERMKLRVHLHRGGAGNARELDTEVMNDVVIAKGALARMVEFDTSYGAHYVTTYKADGIIVATPTGSTAYALAANGPLVYPSMQGVVIAPICPHTLTQRPLVVPDDESINIVLVSDSGEVYLTLDGQRGVPLERGDRVQVKSSSHRVRLVRNPNIDYFGILRAKLRWGER
ncbi:NAD(+)/NADH kinase [Anaeromyxobacter paludicola]|uniref:NAD kinase n=1 Tax=Anaeromyxobacter paludicola TaxID=2918171 RepID=A0ABM7XAA7_9BACT|nr:NAD(+)/NADH kinase [Anaeromyxobacter paludicola]BDG08779.1 NAD kinase [Anaeromyxobacter paludicola]